MTSPRPDSDEPTVVDAGARHARPDLVGETSAVVFPPRFADQGMVGSGGMGAVHAAHDRDLGREVAIKILLAPRPSPEDRARFDREARVTGRLMHPHIPPVYEQGLLPDGRPYFAMKRVRGESLRQRLDGRETGAMGRAPFALDRQVDTLMRVGEALAYAHAHRVVHRDIKPENVMLGEFGEVQVMDWGLAVRVGDAAPPVPAADAREEWDSSTTPAGAIEGTPAYMAPEQARGELGQIDERTDVFAMGALLYEMLAGAPPYACATLAETLDLAARAAWRPIPERIGLDRSGVPVPPRELVAIAHRAMASSPDARYQTVPELLADLRAFRSHLPVSALRDGFVARAAKWTQRHPVATLSLGFALVLGSGFTQIWAARDRAEMRATVARAERDESRDLARALGDTALHSLEQAARISIEDFNRRWAQSKALGEPGHRFFASLGRDRVRGYLHAVDGLFGIRALTGVGSSAQDHVNRALLRGASGDAAGAIADYDAALVLSPDRADILTNRGAQRCAQGDVTGADLDTERALAIDPRNGDALFNRAAALIVRGDHAAALVVLEQALAVRPRFPEALANRGTAKLACGDLPGALADFDAALSIYPRYVEALTNRGVVRNRLGDASGAAADFEAALAVDPGFPDALYIRGTARLGWGDWGGAIADLDEVISRDPGRLEARINRGAARAGAGNPEGAIADCDAVLASDPARWQAAAIRGNALSALGRTEEALRALRDARSRCDVPAARAQLAAHIRRLGGSAAD